MTRFRALLIVIILATPGSGRLSAQWTSTNGPPGGYITGFADSPGNLFARSGSVYRSTDAGMTWAVCDAGPSAGNQVFIHGSTLLADAGYPVTMWRSSDGGITWSSSDSGLGQWTTIQAMAGLDSLIFAGVAGGVFRSSDDGVTWVGANTGLTNSDVRALLVTGDAILAGTWGGVFRSTDKGLTWTPGTYGLTNINVLTLAMIDTDVFAGTYGGGVYRSTDLGVTWISVDGGFTKFVRALGVRGPDVLAGLLGSGIKRSTDRGASWEFVNSGLANLNVLTLMVQGGEILAGTDGTGIFRSVDSGFTWSHIGSGFPHGQITVLHPMGNDLVAGSFSGISVLRDTVNSWELLNTGFTGYVNASSFTGSSLYVLCRGKIYRSTDRGALWTGLNGGLPPAEVRAFGATGNHLFAGFYPYGIYHSGDSGETWMISNAGLGDPAGIQSIEGIDSMVFAVTGSGTYRSTNFGSTWTLALNRGLRYLTRLGTQLMAVDGNAVYSSVDEGENWSSASSLGASFLGASGSTLFAATTHQIFVSADTGATWLAIGPAIPGNSISALAVAGDYLYVGLDGGGGVLRRPLSQLITGTGEPAAEIPKRYHLGQNYPNPFNPSTTIDYALPTTSHVTLTVFDMLGREVATLVDGEQSPGKRSISWDATTFPTGLYFYRLRAGEFTAERKMVLLK